MTGAGRLRGTGYKMADAGYAERNTHSQGGRPRRVVSRNLTGGGQFGQEIFDEQGIAETEI
jgi:hypothetical protein